MRPLQQTRRFVAFALAIALAAACCIVVPGLVAPGGRIGAPATISHEVLAPGVGQALRADEAAPMQRSLALTALAFALTLGLASVARPAATRALVAAPGSFERPLRI